MVQKITNEVMRKLIIIILSVGSILILPKVFAQEENEMESKPARPAFESQLLIDNQTVVIPTKHTLEWDIQHRFGSVKDGISDLFGLYDPSNIRLGFTYSALDRLNLGFGFTKYDKYLDFNAKYLFLQQTRDNKIPVSVAYYGVAAINGSDAAKDYGKFVDQLSYFNQVLIARRFSPRLSLQLSGSYAHFNAVDRHGPDAVKWDMYGFGLSGRYKVINQISMIFGYQQPLLQQPRQVKTEPNYSIGVEVSTSSHAFQVFIGNYPYLVPQRNLAFNPNEFNSSGIIIGFNITRLWNL